MAKKKSAMADKEKQASEKDRKIVANIKNLMGINTTLKVLAELAEELKEELAAWVKEQPTGTTKQKYPYREIDKYGVLLQDVPRYETDPGKLIGLIGIKPASDFLVVKRTLLVAAIKARVVPLTTKDLKGITVAATGKPKVLTYFGSREAAKSLIDEEEAA